MADIAVYFSSMILTYLKLDKKKKMITNVDFKGGSAKFGPILQLVDIRNSSRVLDR